MSQVFDHQQIEAKWIQKWQETKLYKTPDINQGDQKKYILETFPYPSGYAMHVGHAKGYVGSDVTARYWRMKGYKVLYPMGWDAFGLPAENYAIKTGIHPRPNTENTIEVSKNQLNKIGLSYDWDREIGTHRPDYYRWTQWFFQFLYKRGLAYKKDSLVNWDPVDKTVLANEQVLADGTAERSGAVVEQRMMSQWFFKITDYADRLIDDLDKVDWPDSTKLMQRNWVGRSVGAEVDFRIEGSAEKIRVFTTAHDTIFGCTFVVLSPEHKLVDSVTTAENIALISEYKEQAKSKSQLQRTDLNKDKNGLFTGSFAINPINGEKIEIWVADYVLSNYGTGAVMGVPGNDERDFEFANKYSLPIIFTADKEEFISYSEKIKPEKIKHTLINSGKYTGINFEQARELILNDLINLGAGEAKLSFRLRDWSISRQRYWGCPIPVLYKPKENTGEGGMTDGDWEVELVPETDLPVILPEDVEFAPTGRSPLLDHKEFHQSAQKYGTGYKRESDTMDTFVDSSWYFFRYCSPVNDNTFADPEEMKKWMPVDQYIIGAEHSNMHLLYARFFTKVLFDAGLINFDEPFLRVRHQGMVAGEDARKMSKRWGNVVNPNDVCDEVGADSLRTYEMFMGPFKDGLPWSTSTIKGVKRFLDKVWKMQDKIVDVENEKIESSLHRLIKKIGSDIEDLSFNTAVAEYMKFSNLVDEIGGVSNSQFARFLKVLAPFAPFMAEEIWQNLYHKGQGFEAKNSIHKQLWPVFDESLTVDDEVVIGVQINGKTRGEVLVDEKDNSDSVLEKVKQDEKLVKYFEGEIVKVIYVPKRIFNVIVK